MSEPLRRVQGVRRRRGSGLNVGTGAQQRSAIEGSITSLSTGWWNLFPGKTWDSRGLEAPTILVGVRCRSLNIPLFLPIVGNDHPFVYEIYHVVGCEINTHLIIGHRHLI